MCVCVTVLTVCVGDEAGTLSQSSRSHLHALVSYVHTHTRPKCVHELCVCVWFGRESVWCDVIWTSDTHTHALTPSVAQRRDSHSHIHTHSGAKMAM